MKFLFLFYLQTIVHSLERSLINIKLILIIKKVHNNF